MKKSHWLLFHFHLLLHRQIILLFKPGFVREKFGNFFKKKLFGIRVEKQRAQTIGKLDLGDN